MTYRLAIIATVLLALFVGYQAYLTYLTYNARSAIFETEAATVIGPENADLTIVEFMDYACVHCREIHPVIKQAVEEDGKVRLIIRPLPSMSEDGSSFGRMAYAAASLGKFKEAHDFLIANFGPLDAALVDKMAPALGMEAKALHEAYENPEIDREIWHNMDYFRALGAVATPTFFLAPDWPYIPEGSMPSAEDFKTMFNQAREKQK